MRLAISAKLYDPVYNGLPGADIPPTVLGIKPEFRRLDRPFLNTRVVKFKHSTTRLYLRKLDLGIFQHFRDSAEDTQTLLLALTAR